MSSMEPADWDNSEKTLTAVAELMAITCDPPNARLSELLQSLIPHAAMAVLTGSCARSPMASTGDPEVAERITSADLGRLAGTVAVGEPWSGTTTIAGQDRPVVAFAAGPHGQGALLVLVREDDTPLPPSAARVAQQVWSVFSARLTSHIEDADPANLSASRAAASERERVTADLTDVQAATLSGLLGTLRSRDLDDDAARRTAIDLAAAALVELRASAERENELTDERADRAFLALRDEMAPLARFGSADIDFATPQPSADPDATLPAPVAQAARAIVRRAVLTMLDQGNVGRVRVSWDIGEDLAITVRDDGSGDLSADALALQAMVDRAEALGGTVEIEGVPDWGTRILARLPLRPVGQQPLQAHPLDVLGPRERDVLEQLARGRRNRQIAEDLTISENTVKFHVANVLSKLGVHSRGEAAAMARENGLPGVAPLTAVS